MYINVWFISRDNTAGISFNGKHRISHRNVSVKSGLLTCSLYGQIRDRVAISDVESFWKATSFIADLWRTFLASLVTEFLERESKMFLLIRCQVVHDGLLIVSNRSDLMIAVVVLKGNIAYCGTQRVHKMKKNKTKHNTTCVGHHYMQSNTNNINKTTGGKAEPNIVIIRKL